MRKFPKVLNTKADVNLCLEMFPEKTKAFLQLELDGYRGWVPTGTYDSKDNLLEDGTHEITESTDEENNTVYTQKVYMVIPGNWIDRTGYTEEEVSNIIKEN